MYYILDDENQPNGPYDLDDIAHDVMTGVMPYSTQICKEGENKWIPISSSTEVKNHIKVLKEQAKEWAEEEKQQRELEYTEAKIKAIKADIKKSNKKSLGCLIFFIIALFVFFAAIVPDNKDKPYESKPNKPNTSRIESKTEQSKSLYRNALDAGSSYDDLFECEGFFDGWIVGGTDAVEGRKRDGEKAMRLAKINAKGTEDPKTFEKNYHYGYNTGWHDADKNPNGFLSTKQQEYNK